MAKLTQKGAMFSLEISEGETPPAGTPKELKNLFANPNFWRELDDDYYKDRPEEWENGSFYVDAEFFKPILDGLESAWTRPRLPNETVTEDAIWRAERKIWRVGLEVFVTTTYRVPAPGKDKGVIGKIRLVKIFPVEKDDAPVVPIAARWIDKLTFSKNGSKEIIARGEGKDILTFEVVE